MRLYGTHLYRDLFSVQAQQVGLQRFLRVGVQGKGARHKLRAAPAEDELRPVVGEDHRAVRAHYQEAVGDLFQDIAQAALALLQLALYLRPLYGIFYGVGQPVGGYLAFYQVILSAFLYKFYTHARLIKTSHYYNRLAPEKAHGPGQGLRAERVGQVKVQQYNVGDFLLVRVFSLLQRFSEANRESIVADVMEKFRYGVGVEVVVLDYQHFYGLCLFYHAACPPRSAGILCLLRR